MDPEPKDRVGRPSLLTPALHEQFVELIREGLPIETCCKKCRIHRDTYYKWVERSVDGDEPYAKFIEDVREAEADAEINMFRSVRIDDKFQRHTWMIEKRFPMSWSDRYIERREQEKPANEPTAADAAKVMREFFGSAVTAPTEDLADKSAPPAEGDAKITK